jgi:hypothetical protein
MYTHNTHTHTQYSQIDDEELEAELAALGDELEADSDTTYLDEASKMPGVPSRDPGVDSKVRLFVCVF